MDLERCACWVNVAVAVLGLVSRARVVSLWKNGIDVLNKELRSVGDENLLSHTCYNYIA